MTTTNDDVLNGPGLDAEILSELTDQEAKELADETIRIAHYHDDLFNLLGNMFRPNQEDPQ